VTLTQDLDPFQIMLENMAIRFYTNLWNLCISAVIKAKVGRSSTTPRLVLLAGGKVIRRSHGVYLQD